MEDQDRVSQTSSVATVSFMPTRDKCHEKVQTFGKRCHAVKRDPNCPVVIRGWLYKRDSTGLKLWKRRWFVLSNFCLYYYKDSREESVLGSIPIPSYRILYCSPRECRNRKYAFKVVHQGMRPYIMSAETQEDMLGWVRALSQSANMESDDIINRRCSSFQDFTQMSDDTEMMELQQTPTFPERNAQTAAKLTRAQTEPTLQDQPMTGIQTKTPELRGKHGTRSRDPEALQQSQSLGKADEEPFSFLLPRETLGTLPLFARDQYGCLGNVGRDGWPLDNCSSSSLSPCLYTERRHLTDTSFPCGVCYCSDYHTAEHMTLCKTGKSDILFGREVQPIRDLENDTDVVLTRLCGCDKLLQSLSIQLTQLHADKKSVEYALERRWFEMEDLLPEEQDVSQKSLLQEDLVTLRARICDVSSEVDRLWSDYERMESELSVFHSHFQHILHFGTPQEQIQAQRHLWMMEDILCGLRVNKNRFMSLLGLQTPGVPQPKTLSYFDGEFRGHDMDCVTQLEQQ
ncbi:pleckstrin homology domain-containing family A member 7 isoform X2 [Triplophysa rosa]|nr:pleckstrin homology domain-containing family A member 7 isoform X2 [Triplophysa rosa]